MANGALYNIKTGLIQQTLSPPLSNAEQLAGLAEMGLIQVVIPDGKNGGTGMIDVATGEYTDFAPQPPPLPSLMTQYIAAQLKSGQLPLDSLHPATLAELDAALVAAKMAPVKP